MKKPKDYETWHRRGVDWCRERFGSNLTHGEGMKAYIDYELWRVARDERITSIVRWVTLACSIVAAAGVIASQIGRAS